MVEGRKMDLGQTAKQIVSLLEPELATDGYELLDVRIYQGGGRMQVRIYVDLLEPEEGTGINMKQVARASRSANMLLEEADLFLGNYIVEVSSPGIRRPLRKQAHFEAALGQKVEVAMWGKTKRVRGVLVGIDGGKIIVEPAGGTPAPDGDEEVTETVSLSIDRIYEANLDLEFDAQAIINADRRQRKDEKRQKRQEKQTKRRGRPKAPKGQNTKSPADGGADES